MAVLTREDFIARINERIGDDNSDEAISFIEDMSDTFEDMSARITDSTDWKKKYEENDTEWRNKYRERFTSKGSNDDIDEGENDEPKTPMTFEDLFTKEG